MHLTDMMQFFGRTAPDPRCGPCRVQHRAAVFICGHCAQRQIFCQCDLVGGKSAFVFSLIMTLHYGVEHAVPEILFISMAAFS